MRAGLGLMTAFLGLASVVQVTYHCSPTKTRHFFSSCLFIQQFQVNDPDALIWMVSNSFCNSLHIEHDRP